MFWFRIDNRLVHGQIIETWLPHLRAKLLVVANNDVAADTMRQQIMRLAVPNDIQVLYCSLPETTHVLDQVSQKNTHQHALILFESCKDAQAVHMSGQQFSAINLGNLHYGPNKEQICEHIAISSEDRKCLGYFQKHNVTIDCRCVPSVATKVNL